MMMKIFALFLALLSVCQTRPQWETNPTQSKTWSTSGGGAPLISKSDSLTGSSRPQWETNPTQSKTWSTSGGGAPLISKSDSLTGYSSIPTCTVSEECDATLG